jgi:hypothetical protein
MYSIVEPVTSASLLSGEALGVVGIAASLVGLLLAVYFYLKSRSVRNLVYHVHPAKTIVVRSGQASRMNVTFNDKIIASDVTAAQLALWNRGSLSIRPENILKPIVIYTQNDTPVLEASIRKTSRDIVGLKLDETDYEHGRVTVSWRILEQNDGGVIQLIYEGGADIDIKIGGVIEGQHDLEQTERGSWSDFSRKLNKTTRIMGWLTAAFGALLIVPIAATFLGRYPQLRWQDSLFALAPVALILFGLLMRRGARKPGPPFGYTSPSTRSAKTQMHDSDVEKGDRFSKA